MIGAMFKFSNRLRHHDTPANSGNSRVAGDHVGLERRREKLGYTRFPSHHGADHGQFGGILGCILPGRVWVGHDHALCIDDHGVSALAERDPALDFANIGGR